MPHKLRKTRKHRGSRTQGWGRIGQHRDAGSRPYRKVGMHKHRWSINSNLEESHFGKFGFRSPQALHSKENILNITTLDQLAAQTNQTTLDLTSMGYTKLLGTGKITKCLTVTVPAASKTAQEKIQAAGGKIVTESEAEAEAPGE